MTTANARVLLVEDDNSARLALSNVLSRAGYGVHTVPDGEAAIAVLDASAPGPRFHVVLTDLLLRADAGLQVLRHTRGLGNGPAVILLTGYSTLHTAIEAVDYGAFDYLLKPCSPDDLLGCVERAARQVQGSEVDSDTHQQHGCDGPLARSPVAVLSRLHQPERIGALSLERRSRTVFFRDAPLNLTRTEYALLCCLADAQGQMVTYGEIARYVYRQAVDEATAHQLLKTHIHNLRHKLDPAYIVNVRSAGYRLVIPQSA